MTQPAPAPMRDPPPPLREPQAAAVRASWTARALPMGAVCLGVAAFLTLSGAFGLEPFAAWKRFAYWVGLLGLGTAVSLGGLAWLQREAGPRLWLRLALLVAVMTAVMTPVVFLATRWIFGGGWGWGELASFLLPVAVVSALMTALNALTLHARQGATRAAAASSPAEMSTSALPAAPAVDARFRERLPPRLRAAEVYAVEAEDHYLRVHTDRGSDLLLMRLADAVDELAGVEGAQCHRSWWVARAAVADVRRGDGRATLTLKDGAQVPVSRSFAPALREAGWF